MERRKNHKSKGDKEFTYDDFLKTFFPKPSSKEGVKTEDPSTIGTLLAKESLSKLEKALNHKSK